MPQLKKILLPTAFSELSKRAVPYVRMLATEFDAEIHLVHVVPHSELILEASVPGGAIPVLGPGPQELLMQSRLSLEKFVRELIPDLSDRTRTHTSMGGIVDEIVKHAQAYTIDMIVMSTHADGMLKRIIWGSISKSVMERAPCPVLLVPVHDAPRT
jgi:nucleotide-binding universal stress UspA family protein